MVAGHPPPSVQRADSHSMFPNLLVSLSAETSNTNHSQVELLNRRQIHLVCAMHGIFLSGTTRGRLLISLQIQIKGEIMAYLEMYSDQAASLRVGLLSASTSQHVTSRHRCFTAHHNISSPSCPQTTLTHIECSILHKRTWHDRDFFLKSAQLHLNVLLVILELEWYLHISGKYSLRLFPGASVQSLNRDLQQRIGPGC